MQHITAADVEAFAPSDPGYADYVRAFTNILSTRELPARADFDITETIGLTRWANAEKETDSNRFRRFRIFTNAVGLSLCVNGEADNDSLPANYSVISLIDDASALADQELLRRLLPAFDEFHNALIACDSVESPFVLLGSLLVSVQLGTGAQDLSLLADQIIDEERKHAGRVSGDFLLGCTFFDQLHGKWKAFVTKLVPAKTPSLALLREALIH